MNDILKQRLREFLGLVKETEKEFTHKTRIDLTKDFSVSDIVTVIATYKNMSGRWWLNGEGHAMIDGSFNIMNFHAENVHLAPAGDACNDCASIKGLSFDLANSRALVRSLSHSLEEMSKKVK